MIIKIHQACSTKNALFYNERKVERKRASFFHHRHMPVVNPFMGNKSDRYRIFREIEDRNTRVKKPGLHISVNPTISDLVKLGDAGIRREIDHLMKHLGYGDQPYLVYKHADLDRVHFHIVSTRIDKETGKKIKDNYEREKTQRFVKSLEQKYQLTKDDSQKRLNYRFSGSSKNLKVNLESLFGRLNQMEFITSKEMYDKALSLFQVGIKQAGRGYLVLITDEQGNPVRHPIKMSDFEKKPLFYGGDRLDQTYRISNTGNSAYSNYKDLNNGLLKSLVLKGLMSQVARSYNSFDERKNNYPPKTKKRRNRKKR